MEHNIANGTIPDVEQGQRPVENINGNTNRIIRWIMRWITFFYPYLDWMTTFQVLGILGGLYLTYKMLHGNTNRIIRWIKRWIRFFYQHLNWTTTFQVLGILGGFCWTYKMFHCRHQDPIWTQGRNTNVHVTDNYVDNSLVVTEHDLTSHYSKLFVWERYRVKKHEAGEDTKIYLSTRVVYLQPNKNDIWLYCISREDGRTQLVKNAKVTKCTKNLGNQIFKKKISVKKDSLLDIHDRSLNGLTFIPQMIALATLLLWLSIYTNDDPILFYYGIQAFTAAVFLTISAAYYAIITIEECTEKNCLWIWVFYDENGGDRAMMFEGRFNSTDMDEKYKTIWSAFFAIARFKTTWYGGFGWLSVFIMEATKYFNNWNPDMVRITEM